MNRATREIAYRFACASMNAARSAYRAGEIGDDQFLEVRRAFGLVLALVDP